jgi:hypothetical protein
MSIFDRKRNEPSKDDISTRLSQYVSQTYPTVPPPAPEAEPTQEEDDHTYEDVAAPAAAPVQERVAEPAPAPPTPRFEPAPEPPRAPTPPAFAAVPPPVSPVTPVAAPVAAPAPARPAGPATNQFTAVDPNARMSAGNAPSFFPKRPETLDDTGLPRPFVVDLLLRTLYQANELTGAVLAERVTLPFQGIVGPLLEGLRHEQAVEVKGQRGIGDAGYLYGITEKGVLRARDSMEKLTYWGPAPVPLDEYNAAVLAQTVRNVVVTQENIRVAFNDLIINEDVLDQVGPAVNSGSSMFLFGYPGNGKTSIAERITKLMGDYIFVPHAIEVDGAVVKLFDAINHSPVEEKGPDGQPKRPDWDPRWVKIERPVVMVGGELIMDSLDLLYNESGKYYEAPLQMKANGGMFLIDDFGRQMVRPQDLLNRWIVPLEKRVDFLTLITGKKIAIPFEQLIVFSTNLDPKDLVDDAFLRRIKFKINVEDPDESQFRAIFQLMCNRRGVPFDSEGYEYMLDKFYTPFNRPLRMCHPRDIIDQIISIAKYKIVPAEMTKPLLDRACETYFVSMAS